MVFSTANSSFIFDRLRRSMRLWAVFLAIFLPAALVVDGCFFLPPATAADAASVPSVAVFLAPGPDLAVGFSAAASDVSPSTSFLSCFLGFMCMIFRDLVGGGGSANSLSFAVDGGRFEREGCDTLVSVGDASRGASGIAGGGNSNDI